MKKDQKLAIQAVSRHYSEAISISRWTLLENINEQLGSYLEKDAPGRSEEDASWLKRLSMLLDILFDLENESGTHEWGVDGTVNCKVSQRDYAQAQYDAFQTLAQTYLMSGLPKEFAEDVQQTVDTVNLVLESTRPQFFKMLDNIYAEARRLELKAGLIEE